MKWFDTGCWAGSSSRYQKDKVEVGGGHMTKSLSFVCWQEY